MNTLQSHPYESACDAYASRVVARLDDTTGELPYDISERLRAARMQALAQRKKLFQYTRWRPPCANRPQRSAGLVGWRWWLVAPCLALFRQ